MRYLIEDRLNGMTVIDTTRPRGDQGICYFSFESPDSIWLAAPLPPAHERALNLANLLNQAEETP